MGTRLDKLVMAGRTYKLQIEYNCLKLKDLSVLNASKGRKNYLLNEDKRGLIFFYHT